MEVFHRRLVPRGFLPVQRTPGTHHDRQRFYQWICQYNTLCVDAVARTMETPLQTDEVEDAQALDAGPPVSMEQPSSSSGPALTSLNRARSRSRTRGSSASSSSSSLATAEVTAEPAASVVDMEAEQMLQATLRGDPPVLPSWALPGLTPSELPGLWHEDSPVGVTSPVNEVAADASPSPLLSSTTSSTTRTWWQQIELVDMLTNTTSSASNTWQIVATLASTTSSTTSSWRPSWELGVWFQGEMLYWSNSTVWWTSSTTSTTSTSSSEMLWPGEVVRDTVNLQAILAGGVDRVQILQRLLERQRYLLHEQRLLNEALEELAFWLPHASAAIPFNAAGMEWTIWQSVQREAQFGSARSTSSTSRFALTPSFLLMPELPRSTEAVWQQFPPETPRSVIAGYRRRVWRSHLLRLHEHEGLAPPEPARSAEPLVILQRDETRPVRNLPTGEAVPGIRRLNSTGAYGRRRHRQPRPAPLLRDRSREVRPSPPRRAHVPDPPDYVPRAARAHLERSRSRATDGSAENLAASAAPGSSSDGDAGDSGSGPRLGNSRRRVVTDEPGSATHQGAE